MLKDAHAHLNDPAFLDDVDEVVNKLKDSGVGMVVNAAWDRESAIKAMELAEKYSGFYFTIGVHPHQSKDAIESDFYIFEDLAKHEKCVAYGEIGLDYHYDLSPRDVQRKIFEYQLQIADSLSLPVVLHLREAYKDANDILSANKNKLNNGVLLHCYSGSMELARDFYNKLDCYYSFGGAITFKNANKGDTLRAIPKNRILLETDCPYMTPVPFRGQRNDPSYIGLTRNKMAEELNLTSDEIEEITSQNFDNFYRIKK